MMTSTRQLSFAALALFLGAGCIGSTETAPVEETPLLGDPCLDRGETDVCVSLGKRSLSGTRPDYPKARLYLSRACLVNHPEACNLFGELLQEGRGGPVDLRRATKALSVACDAEQKDACTRLADTLLEPNNPIANPSKALDLLAGRCGAEPSILKSCERYGDALAAGTTGLPADPEAAMNVFRKACSSGLQSSCVRQAGVLMTDAPKEPFARSPELEEAGALLRSACKGGDVDGCFTLGELERDGKLAGASSVRAAMLFRAVCSADPARGCFEIAQLMEQGLVKSRRNEVASLYSVACENGRTEACIRRNQLPNPAPE